MIQKINSVISNVEVGELQDSTLTSLLSKKYHQNKKIILLDKNTKEFCLPVLLQSIPELINAHQIVIESGEVNKKIETCSKVWKQLIDLKINRHDLIINLGGGVITDLGGFIATLYKRGMDFINIPTTLLGMVDASVGGKTGVNFGENKNQIGVFSLPQLTVCDIRFLKTLPKNQLLSGKAEILKHGLIDDKDFFQYFKENFNKGISKENLFKAIQIKTNIVDKDFKESGDRKKMNFGHTVGHAIEAYLMTQNNPVEHGVCIAWGMLVESYLSSLILGLSEQEFQEIELLVKEQYPRLELSSKDFDAIIRLMHNDKKNQSEKLNFTLLSSIGTSSVNYNLEDELVYKALSIFWD
ncbi:MAG: 3-dehydroquinate synthase [Brumimicrobium sp.]